MWHSTLLFVLRDLIVRVGFWCKGICRPKGSDLPRDCVVEGTLSSRRPYHATDGCFLSSIMEDTSCVEPLQWTSIEQKDKRTKGQREKVTVHKRSLSTRFSCSISPSFCLFLPNEDDGVLLLWFHLIYFFY